MAAAIMRQPSPGSLERNELCVAGAFCFGQELLIAASVLEADEAEQGG
ncbi:MAG: hypothetical protein QOI98_3544 [Solirubrobacteraceae bacterium]|jgi:hypothetical protein|nr:hypothetical protein [Solirubrobacteraceae bacterium]